MSKLALIDIDGVIADERHRTHFAEAKNWPHYFLPENVMADGVWVEGVALVHRLVNEGWQIGYLTGRREEVRPATETWLDRHSFPWGRLIMRPLPDGKPKLKLPKFKVQVMKSLPDLWDQVVLFDDDPAVVELVQREIGEGSAIHCTWHIKPEFLVKRATV